MNEDGCPQWMILAGFNWAIFPEYGNVFCERQI